MPSVLVETGFISNPAEANYLKSEEGQQNIAMSIINAFRKFKAKYSGVNIPLTTESKPTINSHHIAADRKAESINTNNTNELKRDTNSADKTTKVEITAPKQVNFTTVDTNKRIKVSKPMITESTASTIDRTINKDINNSPVQSTLTTGSTGENKTYYSVQIAANIVAIEPVASNFKGLKDVRREKSDKYFRYYVGRESSIEKTEPLLQKIQLKFPQAFIVSFVDGKRIINNNQSK
jgi:N-acetylmuramoyl-L-alanine amidase